MSIKDINKTLNQLIKTQHEQEKQLLKQYNKLKTRADSIKGRSNTLLKMAGVDDLNTRRDVLMNERAANVDETFTKYLTDANKSTLRLKLRELCGVVLKKRTLKNKKELQQLVNEARGLNFNIFYEETVLKYVDKDIKDMESMIQEITANSDSREKSMTEMALIQKIDSMDEFDNFGDKSIDDFRNMQSAMNLASAKLEEIEDASSKKTEDDILIKYKEENRKLRSQLESQEQEIASREEEIEDKKDDSPSTSKTFDEYIEVLKKANTATVDGNIIAEMLKKEQEERAKDAQHRRHMEMNEQTAKLQTEYERGQLQNNLVLLDAISQSSSPDESAALINESSASLDKFQEAIAERESEDSLMNAYYASYLNKKKMASTFVGQQEGGAPDAQAKWISNNRSMSMRGFIDGKYGDDETKKIVGELEPKLKGLHDDALKLYSIERKLHDSQSPTKVEDIDNNADNLIGGFQEILSDTYGDDKDGSQELIESLYDNNNGTTSAPFNYTNDVVKLCENAKKDLINRIDKTIRWIQKFDTESFKVSESYKKFLEELKKIIKEISITSITVYEDPATKKPKDSIAIATADSARAQSVNTNLNILKDINLKRYTKLFKIMIENDKDKIENLSLQKCYENMAKNFCNEIIIKIKETVSYIISLQNYSEGMLATSNSWKEWRQAKWDKMRGSSQLEENQKTNKESKKIMKELRTISKEQHTMDDYSYTGPGSSAIWKSTIKKREKEEAKDILKTNLQYYLWTMQEKENSSKHTSNKGYKSFKDICDDGYTKASPTEKLAIIYSGYEVVGDLVDILLQKNMGKKKMRGGANLDNKELLTIDYDIGENHNYLDFKQCINSFVPWEEEGLLVEEKLYDLLESDKFFGKVTMDTLIIPYENEEEQEMDEIKKYTVKLKDLKDTRQYVSSSKFVAVLKYCLEMYKKGKKTEIFKKNKTNIMWEFLDEPKNKELVERVIEYDKSYDEVSIMEEKDIIEQSRGQATTGGSRFFGRKADENEGLANLSKDMKDQTKQAKLEKEGTRFGRMTGIESERLGSKIGSIQEEKRKNKEEKKDIKAQTILLGKKFAVFNNVFKRERSSMIATLSESSIMAYISQEFKAYNKFQEEMNNTILTDANKTIILDKFKDKISDTTDEIKAIIAEIWYITLLRLPLNATITETQLLYAEYMPEFADILSNFNLGISALNTHVERYVGTLDIKNEPTKNFAIDLFLSLSQLNLIEFLTPVYNTNRSQIRGAITRNKMSTTKTDVSKMNLNQQQMIENKGMVNQKESFDESEFDDIFEIKEIIKNYVNFLESSIIQKIEADINEGIGNIIGFIIDETNNMFLGKKIETGIYSQENLLIKLNEIIKTSNYNTERRKYDQGRIAQLSGYNGLFLFKLFDSDDNFMRGDYLSRPGLYRGLQTLNGSKKIVQQKINDQEIEKLKTQDNSFLNSFFHYYHDRNEGWEERAKSQIDLQKRYKNTDIVSIDVTQEDIDKALKTWTYGYPKVIRKENPHNPTGKKIEVIVDKDFKPGTIKVAYNKQSGGAEEPEEPEELEEKVEEQGERVDQVYAGREEKKGWRGQNISATSDEKQNMGDLMSYINTGGCGVVYSFTDPCVNNKETYDTPIKDNLELAFPVLTTNEKYVLRDTTAIELNPGMYTLAEFNELLFDGLKQFTLLDIDKIEHYTKGGSRYNLQIKVKNKDNKLMYKLRTGSKALDKNKLYLKSDLFKVESGELSFPFDSPMVVMHDEEATSKDEKDKSLKELLEQGDLKNLLEKYFYIYNKLESLNFTDETELKRFSKVLKIVKDGKEQYDAMMDTQHILDIYENGVKTYLKSLKTDIENQMNGKKIEPSVRNKIETLLDLAGEDDDYIKELNWNDIENDTTGVKMKELFDKISNKPKSNVASVAEREIESFKLLFIDESSIDKYIYEYELFYGTNKGATNELCTLETEEQELKAFMEKAKKMNYERDELLEVTREVSNVSKIAEITEAYEEAYSPAEEEAAAEEEPPVAAEAPAAVAEAPAVAAEAPAAVAEAPAAVAEAPAAVAEAEEAQVPAVADATAPVAEEEEAAPVAAETGGKRNRYKHSFKSRKRKGGKKVKNAHSMRKGKRRGTKGSRKR